MREEAVPFNSSTIITRRVIEAATALVYSVNDSFCGLETGMDMYVQTTKSENTQN
jgi:hypothetical protein